MTQCYPDIWSGWAISAPGVGGHAGCVQAEELDDLVQRLAVAKYALAAGEAQAAADAIDAALAQARRLMTSANGDTLLRSRAAPD